MNAYRCLARNQQLNPQMLMALQGKRVDVHPQCPTPSSSPFHQPQNLMPPQNPQQVSNFQHIRFHAVFT